MGVSLRRRPLGIFLAVSLATPAPAPERLEGLIWRREPDSPAAGVQPATATRALRWYQDHRLLAGALLAAAGAIVVWWW